MQPGDVPATYADIDDLTRGYRLHACNPDRGWHRAVRRWYREEWQPIAG